MPAQPRKFLIDVNETLQALLDREDTDKNMQITIEDVGPKVRPCPADYTEIFGPIRRAADC